MNLFNVQVVDKETKKVEAIVGDKVDNHEAEKLQETTMLLVDNDKYDVKVMPCIA